MCGLGCELTASRRGFHADTRPRRAGGARHLGWAIRPRSAPRSRGKPSRTNGSKFGRPRKVDDAEHIATAKLMKADGDTPDVASVVLGVQRMFASTNGCPWACVVPCEWGRVGSPGSRTPSQRRSRIWRRRCRCTTCITTSLVRTRPLTKQANGYKMTPAMAAGIERRIWTHTDIAALLD